MGPAEVFENANGEIFGEDRGIVGIVVTDGGCAAEKIADAAPPEASFAWNFFRSTGFSGACPSKPANPCWRQEAIASSRLPVWPQSVLKM